MKAYLADGLQLRPAPMYSIRPIDVNFDLRDHLNLERRGTKGILTKIRAGPACSSPLDHALLPFFASRPLSLFPVSIIMSRFLLDLLAAGSETIVLSRRDLLMVLTAPSGSGIPSNDTNGRRKEYLGPDIPVVYCGSGSCQVT
jgi:hypothetical protein